jgi:hypothetical protein
VVKKYDSSELLLLLIKHNKPLPEDFDINEELEHGADAKLIDAWLESGRTFTQEQVANAVHPNGYDTLRTLFTHNHPVDEFTIDDVINGQPPDYIERVLDIILLCKAFNRTTTNIENKINEGIEYKRYDLSDLVSTFGDNTMEYLFKHINGED